MTTADNIRAILRESGEDHLGRLSDDDLALRATLGDRVLDILSPSWAVIGKDRLADIRHAARELGFLGGVSPL